VKITSDAPKSFPLVHHLPSIDAGAAFDWPLVRDELAGGLGGFADVPPLFAGALLVGFGFGLSVLPPAGWANATVAKHRIEIITRANRLNMRDIRRSPFRYLRVTEPRTIVSG
jgi:hypothetical protein